MATNLIDLASDVYTDILGEPPDCSLPSISHWFSVSLGQLNLAIDTLYTFTDETHQTLNADMTGPEKSIWKQQFVVGYLERQYRKSLGAAGYEIIQSVQEGNRKISKFSKTEIAKVYLQAKKDAYDQLLSMISAYRLNASNPCQVNINDIVMPEADGSVPPFQYFRFIDSLE